MFSVRSFSLDFPHSIFLVLMGFFFLFFIWKNHFNFTLLFHQILFNSVKLLTWVKQKKKQLLHDVMVSVWSLICNVHSSYSSLNLMISVYVVLMLPLDLSPFSMTTWHFPCFFNEKFLFPGSLRDFLLSYIWELELNRFSMSFSCIVPWSFFLD